MAIQKVGRIVDSISPRYVGFWPCFQAAPDSLTTLIDRSGKGNHCLAGASGIGAGAWANANTFTTTNASTTGAYLPKAAYAAWTWDATNKDTMVWSARILIPTITTAGDTIFRTGTSASTAGWWIETHPTAFTGATPGIRVKLYDKVNGSADVLGYCSITANTEFTFTLVLDGPGNQVYMCVNGVIAPVTSGANPRALSASVNTLTPQASAVDPYVGSSPTGADVKRIRGLHIAIIPESAGPIPDVSALAMRLHRNPFTALTAKELP